MSARASAPLLWRAASDATPLRAWRDGELACVAALLQEAFVSWRRGWGLPVPAAVSVACAPAAKTLQVDEWQPVGCDGVSGAWVQWSAGSDRHLLTLFGAGAGNSSLVDEAAAECRRDAGLRLASVLRLEAGARAREAAGFAGGKWSGAVVATLPCDSRVLLDAACMHRALRAASRLDRAPREAMPPLVPLLEAARRSAIRVEARLCSCELDLALLQGLQAGDVIRLPHALDRPLAVHDPAGHPMFGGFLGRSGGFRAVELTPLGP
jgi:hypothetical protein